MHAWTYYTGHEFIKHYKQLSNGMAVATKTREHTQTWVGWMSYAAAIIFIGKLSGCFDGAHDRHPAIFSIVYTIVHTIVYTV